MQSISVEIVKARVLAGMRRREVQTEQDWKKAFEDFKDPATSLLDKKQLRDALQTLGVVISDLALGDLFDESGETPCDGLDFESFKSAITKQSPIEQWAKTLPFSSMVADAVPMPPSSDQLRFVSDLTRKEIDSIVDGLVDGLKDAFEKHVQLLSRGLKAAAEKTVNKENLGDGSKFQVVSMNCGRVKDFHVGLEGRLGT
jgi:hypothetical protein